MQLVHCAAPAPPTPQTLAQPRKLQIVHCTGAVDPFPFDQHDRRFFPVIVERRAANDGKAQAPSELLNLLVRRALAQSPRRFSGEPITGFGALA